MMQNKGAGCMQVIGITGGIGSGKSEVLHFLSRQQGVKIVEAAYGAWRGDISFGCGSRR